MKSDPRHWEKLAELARTGQTPDRRTGEAGDPGISWLDDFGPRLRALFLRLLWRRAAAVAIVVSVAAVVATCLLAGEDRGASSPGESRSIPIPSVP
jgi:hypothetical protein